MATEEEKQKVRDRQRGYRVDEIKVIKAAEPLSIRDTRVRLRVCAYCRVSTDNIEQTSSFELQKVYYDEYIGKHENWDMVKIYADEGISATSTKHRVAFKQMIEDCKKGKIDLIVTKSVSRFARNVVDCIETIRVLKTLNPPVRVFFESEGIDTGDPSSDVMLNILAIFAQEESHTKSETMNWSIDNRFARGNFLTPRLFGYKIDPDKPDRYILIEEEAEVVRLVYSMYVTGYSPNEIAEIMTKLNYVSNIKGECKWNSGVVNNIISNERRCGMIIARKTYTVDFTTHETRKNVNQKNKYQLDDHHDAIVSRELYEQALRIKEMRRHRNYDLIPSLSVIKEGALKGFVPVCVKYSGFTYENYKFASDFAFEKDKDGNPIRDKVKPIDKRIISKFDLSGYEKVDAQLFSKNGQPVCWFKHNQMYFNRACIDKMKNTSYIEMLFEPTDKLIAIRSSSASHEYAIKWGSTKDDKIVPQTKTSFGISNVLFNCMEWDTNSRYRMVGVRRTKADETIVIFDLNNAEKIQREEFEDEEGTKIRTINQIDEYYLEHFGNEFYTDVYSMKLYLMDIFKTWNLNADFISVEEPQEWLLAAKKLVKEHLSKIMEV